MLSGVVMDIKLKHIRRERDGRVYYRRHGRSVRLREKPGSAAFLREYERAATEARRQSRPVAGAGARPEGLPSTLRWLVIAYYQHCPDFKGYAPRTQRARRVILDAICERHGDKPYKQLQKRHVQAWRDAKADTPEAANTLLKALRGLFKWAVDLGHADHDPAKPVRYLRTGSSGYHTWTIDEVKRFEQTYPLGTTPRLALAILLFTGLRRADAIRLGRQHAAQGWHTVRTGKTKAVVEQPILPALQEAIDAAREAGNLGEVIYLQTEQGRPWTNNGFGNAFRKWCDAAGLPKRCSAHGLRKAGATQLAERGATEAQLMAIYAWETADMARKYTRAADRRRLAGAAE